MSSSQPPTDLTKHKLYAIAILFATILTAIAQTLVVPPTWWALRATKTANKALIAQDHPLAELASSTAPPITPSPATPTSAATLSAMLQGVCGVWLSETSEKKYKLICQSQNSFLIYEVKNQSLTIAGAGIIIEDGRVQADILVWRKKRTAHLRLRLSSDGRKMEGTWQGDDPRESGRVVFYKI